MEERRPAKGRLGGAARNQLVSSVSSSSCVQSRPQKDRSRPYARGIKLIAGRYPPSPSCPPIASSSQLRSRRSSAQWDVGRSSWVSEGESQPCANASVPGPNKFDFRRQCSLEVFPVPSRPTSTHKWIPLSTVRAQPRAAPNAPKLTLSRRPQDPTPSSNASAPSRSDSPALPSPPVPPADP